MAQQYGSGDWHVMAGKETEFVEAWTAFLQSARKTDPGLIAAHLIQDDDDPSHYVSVATWESAEARAGWKQGEEFARLFGVCRSLCDRFSGSDYELVVTI